MHRLVNFLVLCTAALFSGCDDDRDDRKDPFGRHVLNQYTDTPLTGNKFSYPQVQLHRHHDMLHTLA